jgi:hypothetical protein
MTAFLCAVLLGGEVPVLLILGVLAAGAAVALRPASPAILGAATLVILLARGATQPTWESAHLALTVLALAGGVAAMLLVLPRTARRLAVSALILLHFGGILTAVTYAFSPRPWLSRVAFVYFYRPYLEFMSLDHSYSYFCPEPSPSALPWFHIRYADGHRYWIEVPHRDGHALALSYERMRTLAAKIDLMFPPGPVPPAAMYSRSEAEGFLGIPFHPDRDVSSQYRTPRPPGPLYLEGCVRFVARNTPHPADPATPVVAVKVYSVVHAILSPGQVAKGMDPEDPSLYSPYYLGEYDPQGNLKKPEDPLLYWLIPVIDGAKPATRSTSGFQWLRPEDESTLRGFDLLQRHAEFQ